MREFEVELDHALAEGELLESGPEDRRVLVTKIEGDVFAVDLWCSHEQVNLAGGSLIGNEIFCPRHFSSFDVRTGEVTGPPAEASLRSYSATEDGTTLRIQIDDAAE